MNSKKAKSLRKFAKQIVKINPSKDFESVYKGMKKSLKITKK